MNIHKCGTTATTKVGNIPCMITAISIKFDAIQYEVEYHLNGGKQIPMGKYRTT